MKLSSGDSSGGISCRKRFFVITFASLFFILVSETDTVNEILGIEPDPFRNKIKTDTTGMKAACVEFKLTHDLYKLMVMVRKIFSHL